MHREADVVSQLERVLSAERTAIIALDAEKVEALAVTKERLFGELKLLELTELERGRLRGIVEAARRNVLLLSHARELTRSAIESITADKRAVRVSVTG
ncbi:MAG: hypothetical protein JNK04_03415 [Myxococcales bacterium]|nr:hypothetical protein [Myxococcales bacterium]